MKIVHINTFDSQGGAARAAFRLHSAMLKSGVDSCMLVLNKTKKQDGRIKTLSRLQTKFIKPILNEFEKWYCKRLLKNSLRPFSQPVFGNKLTTRQEIKESDVIYIHWVNEFLTLKNIEQVLQLGKPVYWFLHDMWAVTGGCFHSFDCDNYTATCGNCPLLIKSSERDISYQLLKKKLSLFSKYKNLHILTPSVWLASCVRRSTVFSQIAISVIPNLIDTTLYKPIDRHFARRLLNLPQDKKIILFGASFGANNPFKGWSYLSEALSLLALEGGEFAVYIFGSDFDNDLATQIPFPAYFSGRLNDDYSLVALYNASDVFVAPSLADNFPYTIVESLSCNTPVVGFDVGGIPDLIEHKRNGYLAKYKDSQDLAEGIKWVLSDENSLNLACRKSLKDKCSEALVLNKHFGLYGHK
ncbi:glycosyl transferase [Bacteroidales bacterium]|nr:glycosyl transferase [Bacteroidales bacterium]